MFKSTSHKFIKKSKSTPKKFETSQQQETIIKSNKTKSSVILIASNKISTIWELFTFINHNMFESIFIFSIIEKNTIKMQIFVPHSSSVKISPQ